MVTGENANKAFEAVDKLVIYSRDIQRLAANQKIAFRSEQ